MSHIKTTAAAVADRVSDTLGTMAVSSTRIAERDLMLSSQFELRRNMPAFHQVFREALGDKVNQELMPRQDAQRKFAATNWQSLSLVEDNEVEERMFFDRIAQMVSHECEWELREVAAYMGTLMNTGRADEERNPFRAEVIGTALYRAVEAVSEQKETRKILARELGQALSKAMPICYAEILRDLQSRGIQPVGLLVRGTEGPGNQLSGVDTGYESAAKDGWHSTHSQTGEFNSGFASGHDSGFGGGVGGVAHGRSGRAGGSSGGGAGGTHGGGGGHGGTGGTGGGVPTSTGTGALRRGAGGSSASAMPSSRVSSSGGLSSRHGGLGQRVQSVAEVADAQLMGLLRRLTALASRPGGLDAKPRSHGTDYTSTRGRGGPDSMLSVSSRSGDTTLSPASTASAASQGQELTPLMAVNLIRAHRDELMQASTGKLDHMVIDVVGSLFDQILSDSRVPPQMARQIARLQLPVLRVALNDSSFFSSRRHPVRRFVNRIASLACAFEDFDEGPGKQFIDRVRGLVQEIVEGDFDQIELYSAKLAALEAFISQQTQGEVEQTPAAATLESKESELRIQQRYMLQLQGALANMSLPPYLRDFLSQVWSQALVLAARRDGAESDRAKRFKRAGRDLVMSVQPKGSLALRKKFLMQLPPLMKDLNEGMKLIGWPEAAQKDFFSKLLPAHAESLKGQPLSDLDHNMMVKQLEGVFNTTVPGVESLSLADTVPEVAEEVIERRFSPEEVQDVGLVQESAVDWSGNVETTSSAGVTLDGDAEGDTQPGDSLPLSHGLGLDINVDTAPSDPPEPSRGPQLMEHIKLGFAYQMHLKDEWQKVRLTYLSPARSFFVFTRGKKHQETISMTSRMLARMCETGRMRAFESAYLMERATQRARKQLAALKAPSRL